MLSMFNVKIQIRSTLRCYLSYSGRLLLRKQRTINVEKNVGKEEHSLGADGSVHGYRQAKTRTTKKAQPPYDPVLSGHITLAPSIALFTEVKT